jgi:DinB superfamily
MNPKDPVREQVVFLLQQGNAHIPFAEAIADFPPALRGVRPKDAAHSGWELLEHMRIAQWDIVEFCRSAKHVSPEWPSGYWPARSKPPSEDAWEESIAAFQKDLRTMVKLVSNPKTDLFARMAHGTGQNILREALVLADHNAYHLGQLVLVRQLVGAWPRSQ